MELFIIELGNFIVENLIEIFVGVGTIITLIITRGKNLEETKAAKQKKLASLKAKNNVAAEALKASIEKEQALEKELNNG